MKAAVGDIAAGDVPKQPSVAKAGGAAPAVADPNEGLSRKERCDAIYFGFMTLFEDY